MKDEKEKYSFTLRNELHRRIKMKAAQQGLKMNEYIEAGMILVSDKNKKEVEGILERVK